MLRHRSPVLIAAAALALSLAACGDDDDDGGGAATTVASEGSAPGTEASSGGTEAPGGTGEEIDADAEDYVDALAAQVGDDDTARCVAGEFVDAIGVDQLHEAGITPEDFVQASTFSSMGVNVDDATADELESNLADCGDLVDLVLNVGDASDEQAQCAEDHLSNEIAAEAFVSSFLEREPRPETQESLEAFRDCANPDG